jgi:hypothetical protein
MTVDPAARQSFTLAAVVQSGRLAFEAVLLAASLRRWDPGFSGRFVLMEPQPGPMWPEDPRLPEGPARALLRDLGAEFLPFDSRLFGAAYPYGNKIEGLTALPEGPFLFLDTDTLVTGPLSAVPFDFARPAASMRREGTWPRLHPGGPDIAAIWGALYHRFGLEIAPSLDHAWPADDWRHYLYFNAGWFFHASPATFGATFARMAEEIRADPPPELAGQRLDPWLDQVALPLVIHALGGGRPGPDLAGLDGDVTCHWRSLPLLYAQESDRVVACLEDIAADRAVARVLRDHPPFRRMVLQGEGHRARALFDREALPQGEQPIRKRLKREGLWLR